MYNFWLSADDECYDYPYEPSLHLQHNNPQQKTTSSPNNNLYDQADPQAMKGTVKKNLKLFYIFLISKEMNMCFLSSRKIINLNSGQSASHILFIARLVENVLV